MKRIYLCAALLLCAAACAPAPTDNANSNANMSNMNAANSNMMSAASWTDDDVIAGDRKAWDLIKAKDYDAFAAGLDEKFIDVTPEGIMDKAATVAFVKTLNLTEATLSDFKVLRLDKDAAVVTYTVHDKGTIGGKPIPADSPGMRHSTAKVWRGGKWLAVFHQSSLIEPPMAVPGGANANTANANAANANRANANAANSNGAATAASPAMMTADVEANEKAVWDALKRKDWDAFASFLAEDSLEVEGRGVYDKAGTLSSVKAFDFTSTSMSDCKATAIDEDAKINTCTVKGMDPNKKPFTERATTIWVNRGGKWMAAFHQGTTVAKPAM
ncbi:MAG: DUF4440 domain-containing protein [Pyrinomonadaceae bacterium]